MKQFSFFLTFIIFFFLFSCQRQTSFSTIKVTDKAEVKLKLSSNNKFQILNDDDTKDLQSIMVH